MQESKFQVIHWKKWKDTLRLLKETKRELQYDVKAISYSNEAIGSSHATVAEKYNKLIEQLNEYDSYITMYDTLIHNLERAIATLLNEEEREVIIIYANFPRKGQSDEREMSALSKGYSRSTFYDIAKQSFDKLDSYLDLSSIEANDRNIPD